MMNYFIPQTKHAPIVFPVSIPIVLMWSKMQMFSACLHNYNSGKAEILSRVFWWWIVHLDLVLDFMFQSLSVRIDVLTRCSFFTFLQ
jgi:hypothetical protein